DLGGVGELRDPLRVHERADLDVGQPGVAERVDEGDLRVGRDHARLVLQPVARADLVDRDLARQAVGDHAALPFRASMRSIVTASSVSTTRSAADWSCPAKLPARIAMTVMPAARPAAMPAAESSRTTQLVGATPRRAAAAR